ncbi:MAG: hypothetical protein AAFV62_13600, partial [Pseudomonadota bacterium]
ALNYIALRRKERGLERQDRPGPRRQRLAVPTGGQKGAQDLRDHREKRADREQHKSGEKVAFVGASAKLRFFYAKRLIVAIRLLMREFKARGEDRSESARADAARILRLMDEARAEIAQL